MKYLFTCAIGPVQDFIATARRSRDLWYGSWMLSELAKSAAKMISDQYTSGALIFPSPQDSQMLEPSTELSVPNKVVAIIDDPPEVVGDRIFNRINKRLAELKDDAFRNVKGDFNAVMAEQQVDDLIEFYWVGFELENEIDYPKVRDIAEVLLASRKNTRDFAQMIGDHSAKSSLDGVRESVIPRTAYPQANDSEQQRTSKIRDLYHNYNARQSEHLSGVDLLKRLGTSKWLPKFKSTSHMAAQPFLERVTREKGESQMDTMLKTIQKQLDVPGRDNQEIDGSIVFESRIADWVPIGQQQDILREQLTEVLQKYAGNLRPNPYYALLLADGDNMGKIIDAQKDPAAHRNLSRALSEFAFEAPRIISGDQGVPVYAGGDDILAYLPLHSVLGCAFKLEQTFISMMKGFIAYDENGEEIYPTLSTGIVVAHHLMPLSDVLSMARGAEKEAKGVEGKNGLAVTISKRGGVERTIQGKWKDLYARLHKLIEFTRTGAISAGTAYELQELHRFLVQTNVPVDGLVGEALRIVMRKRESGGERVISKHVRVAFHQWLVQDNISSNDLAMEMIVAQMFASVADLVEGSVQRKEETTL